MSGASTVAVATMGSLQVQHMDRKNEQSLGALLRRLSNRANQWVAMYTVRGVLKAHALGPEAFHAFVAQQRKLHYRFDAPIMPTLEADAVREIGPPGPVLGSPP